MKIFFYANGSKAEALDAAKSLAAQARRLRLVVVEKGNEADVVVVLGGDGTMLRAVHEFPGVALLGLNLGGLGYLAKVERKDFAAALEALAKGKYSISSRTMIAARKKGRDYLALNDVAVSSERSGHAAVMDVECDGRAVTRYMADGLVIATPTGSTAYSLAAGGPVLMPDASVLVLTPLNPHALGSRPVVLKDTVTLAVTARSRVEREKERLAVYSDGVKSFELASDETAEIRRSTVTARLVELEGCDPYETLAKKLGWAGSSVGDRQLRENLV